MKPAESTPATLKLVDFENMEHVKCAGCEELFMLDSRFKADRMEDGEYFYCPAGCSLTFDKDRALIEAKEEEPERDKAVVITLGGSQLSAHPVDNEGARWQVNFGGSLDSTVLNEIINDMYDQLLVFQGVAPDEIGCTIRGTATAMVTYEARKMREAVEALEKKVERRLTP